MAIFICAEPFGGHSCKASGRSAGLCLCLNKKGQQEASKKEGGVTA